jgi:hypothetical protein
LLSGLLLCFPSLLEAIAETITGRDISYTATFGILIGVSVLMRQWMAPALPKTTAIG